MNMKSLIGFGIICLVFVSGCTGYAVKNNITKNEIPLPGAPYTKEDLAKITNVGGDIPKEITDSVLESVAPMIKTFDGQKYKFFSPKLDLTAEENLTYIIFSGEGFIDDKNFDKYELSFLYKDEKVNFDQNIIGFWGIPLEYKKLAEKIARKDEEIVGKQLSFIRWVPENRGFIEMRFGTILITVDLETEEVISKENTK